MIIFVGYQDKIYAIPDSKICNIIQEDKIIRITYEDAKYDAFSDEGGVFPITEVIPLCYENSEVAIAKMREFFRFVQSGDNAFFF